MDFHDPFLVLNLNVLLALTILIAAVSVYFLYHERKERKETARATESFKKIS